MTDELVKRLRNPTYYTHPTTEDGKLAADRIEALTAERDQSHQMRWEAADVFYKKLADSEADNARLREALEPFAAKANGYDGIPPAKYWGDTSFVMRHYDDEEVSVTLGNLRNARAALTGKEPSHE